MLNKIIFIFSLLLIFIFSQDKKKDVVFDNFESGTYDKWEMKGDVFEKNKTPFNLGTSKLSSYKKKKLPNVGRYIATTFYPHANDKATGSLKSKSFTITHKYLNFVIFGGSGGNVGFRLLVNGKQVAVSRGESSITPVEDSFSVSKYMGKKAILELFDNTKGGWGYIGVSNINYNQIPN